jgi:hypothetical protein
MSSWWCYSFSYSGRVVLVWISVLYRCLYVEKKLFCLFVTAIIQLYELCLLFVVQSGQNVTGINLHPHQNQCHSHQASMRADTFTGVSCCCSTCYMPSIVKVTFMLDILKRKHLVSSSLPVKTDSKLSDWLQAFMSVFKKRFKIIWMI